MRLACRLLILPLLALGLAACSLVEAEPQVRGNKIDQELLNELVVGVSTRADVQAMLGTPTARGTFDDDHWFYIAAITRPRVGRVQGIDSQQVLVMNFDQDGVLREVRQLNKDDGRDVGMVARATPTPGNDQTIMQQLLGNVGRFGGMGQSSNTGTSGGGL